MKERWQKISALALAAALTLLGGVQVFADGEQAPLTVGQSEPQPVLLMAASAETANEFTTADGLKYSITDAEKKPFRCPATPARPPRLSSLRR